MHVLGQGDLLASVLCPAQLGLPLLAVRLGNRDEDLPALRLQAPPAALAARLLQLLDLAHREDAGGAALVGGRGHGDGLHEGHWVLVGVEVRVDGVVLRGGSGWLAMRCVLEGEVPVLPAGGGVVRVEEGRVQVHLVVFEPVDV